MYAFRYSRPHDVADAVARLRADSEAKLLAGGMTLIPSMKYRLAAPSALLDIGRLAQLQGIAEVDGRLAIGAGVRHVDVADDRSCRTGFPSLPSWLARSAIHRSATAARSAARSPTTTRPPTIRRRRWRSLPGWSPTGARSRPTILRRPVHHRARTRRDRRTRLVRDSEARRLCEVPSPGLGLRDGRRVRRRTRRRHPGRGDRRRALRLSPWRGRAGVGTRFSAAAVADIDCPADGLNADFHAPAAYRAQLVKVMTAEAVGRALGAVTERNVAPDASSRGGMR